MEGYSGNFTKFRRISRGIVMLLSILYVDVNQLLMLYRLK